MPSRFALLPLVAVFVVANPPLPRDDLPVEPLFDGETLNGWKQFNGPAHFSVRDGTIVGAVVKHRLNSFLVTQATFDNFVFECEFKVSEGVNSGIQFRSHSDPDYRDGRVFGYQYEIDPTPRALTGGLFEEGRRGWLQPERDDRSREAWRRTRGDHLRAGEWNQVRIECRGAHIRTWLNGNLMVDVHDEGRRAGFIGLQVHQTDDDALVGREVAWRNLRVRRLAAP